MHCEIPRISARRRRGERAQAARSGGSLQPTHPARGGAARGSVEAEAVVTVPDAVASAAELLWRELREIGSVDRKREEPIRLGGHEVVVVGDDEQVPPVRQVGSEGEALDLLRKRCSRQPERGIEEVEERRLGDRRYAVRRSRLRQRRDRAGRNWRNRTSPVRFGPMTVLCGYGVLPPVRM